MSCTMIVLASCRLVAGSTHEGYQNSHAKSPESAQHLSVLIRYPDVAPIPPFHSQGTEISSLRTLLTSNPIPLPQRLLNHPRHPTFLTPNMTPCIKIRPRRTYKHCARVPAERRLTPAPHLDRRLLNLVFSLSRNRVRFIFQQKHHLDVYK